MSDNTKQLDIAKKLYQVLSFYQTSIIQEIYRCKLYIFKNVEKDLGVVDYELLQRTDVGFLHLTTSRGDGQAETHHWNLGDTYRNVGTDKKRCHTRLNKGRMDLEYSKQVQEELLISKESDKMPIDGAQELNYVMESLVHRIRHGNNKWADEVKLYHEIRNLNDTIEIYTEPTEPDDGPDPWQRRPNLDKRYKQRQLKIVLNELEKARTIRKGQLTLELDRLRKNIKCMETACKKISSLRKKAYKCAYKYGDQQNEVKSSYTEYQSLMTYVKKLVLRGDIEYLVLMTYLKAAANSEL
ncbi:hypothetical protein Tco_1421263 [Tanacetum coccineum]